MQYIVCKYTQYGKLSQQHTHLFCIHINKDHPNNGLSTEGKSYSARATSSATYPMVRRKFTSMHGCNMMPWTVFTNIMSTPNGLS